jgi:hypothetical protein
MSEGRPGLYYYRKTPTALSPVSHMAAVFNAGLDACRLLEKDTRLKFKMDEFVVIANDRLEAPNTEEIFGELRPLLADALQEVFGGVNFKLSHGTRDPKERLTVSVRS